MISSSTFELLNGVFPCRELAKLQVVGRQEPVRVYEPYLQADYQEYSLILDCFAQGLAAFYKGDFSSAIDEFEEIADSDSPASHYLHKCRELMATPLSSWTGVWVLTSK
jgi:hypothetical protein